MKNTIQKDLFRYAGLEGFSGFIKGWMTPGFRYTFLLRKTSQYKKYTPLWCFFAFLKRRHSFKYGFQIPYYTEIGEGFYIGHCGTIVINGKAKIGSNCNITHNVTIGQTNRGKKKGYPTIGDSVWIGTGSVIVGNIVIGSNVLIAPNSFVNLDIPDHSIVIGNPARVIPKMNPCDGYINNIK